MSKAVVDAIVSTDHGFQAIWLLVHVSDRSVWITFEESNSSVRISTATPEEMRALLNTALRLLDEAVAEHEERGGGEQDGEEYGE